MNYDMNMIKYRKSGFFRIAAAILMICFTLFGLTACAGTTDSKDNNDDNALIQGTWEIDTGSGAGYKFVDDKFMWLKSIENVNDNYWYGDVEYYNGAEAMDIAGLTEEELQSSLPGLKPENIFVTKLDPEKIITDGEDKTATNMNDQTLWTRLWLIEENEDNVVAVVFDLETFSMESYTKVWLKTSKELSANDYISNITENDFAEKKWKNLDSVVHVVEKADNFALVLGAGISVDPGAKSWDTLLKQFTAELQRQRLIDDSKALSKKIGGSSLITAQLCKELYTTEADYYWAIHQGLYAGRQAINKKYAIYHIAKIISKCISKKHFRVLTYNYDDYLETYLKNENVSYNTLYNEDCETDDKLSIYHVHGYMPQVNAKTNMLDAHKKSIFLTEQNYNDLYNNPYSWQIASQLSFFRENICLFVGCSLADPNIRRLLEITYRKTKVHYAILAKEKLTNKDLMKASNHFARLGVEIIWANDFNEIPILLQNFYR